MQLPRMLVALGFFLVVVGSAACGSHLQGAGDDSLSFDTSQSTPPARLLMLAPPAFYQPRPVDLITLADLEGYSPLNFKLDAKSYAISHDGRKLAVAAWHYTSVQKQECAGQGAGRECRSGSLQERRLHLVDLENWKEEEVVPGDHSDFYLPTFSADDSSLYYKQMDPSSDNPRRHALYRYDLETGTSSLVAELPTDFNPWEMRLLRDGDRLAMYGSPQGMGRTPQVVIVDLSKGRIAASVSLDGVTDGVVKVEEPHDSRFQFRQYRAGRAWDLRRNRLYVVHPDEDRVTVVDLNAGRVVTQAEIHQGQSLLGRLFGWMTPLAYAKAVPGGERRVALSSDGNRLYITGTQGEWNADISSIVAKPIGLQVVTTDDFRELHRLHLPVSDMALSSDGKWLLLGSRLQGDLSTPTGGVFVLDAESLEQLAHLEPQADSRIYGLSPDGRYAYVGSRTIRSNVVPDTLVKVLDLESLQFVGERSLGPFNPPEVLIGLHPASALHLISVSVR